MTRQFSAHPGDERRQLPPQAEQTPTQLATRPLSSLHALLGRTPRGAPVPLSENHVPQEQSKSHSLRPYLFACTTRGIAGDKPASAFEHVQFGTDADVPKDFQCGKPINAIGECGSLPYPGL